MDVHGHGRGHLLCVSGHCKGVHEQPSHLHQEEAWVRLGLSYHRVYVRRGDHDRAGVHGHGHVHRGDHDRVGVHGHGRDRRGGHCRVDARDHRLYLNLNPNDVVNVSMDPTCKAAL